jgi:hypothetical protein
MHCAQFPFKPDKTQFSNMPRIHSAPLPCAEEWSRLVIEAGPVITWTFPGTLPAQ